MVLARLCYTQNMLLVDYDTDSLMSYRNYLRDMLRRLTVSHSHHPSRTDWRDSLLSITRP